MSVTPSVTLRTIFHDMMLEGSAAVRCPIAEMGRVLRLHEGVPE